MELQDITKKQRGGTWQGSGAKPKYNKTITMPKINTEDLISVSEFAHSLGISTQRIYQILPNIKESDKVMIGRYLFIKKGAKITSKKSKQA